ncbi:MAG: O-antigen ligase family protein [Gemmataceae bacterium]
MQEKYKDPETGKMVPVQRICGTGLFSDPNDLGLVLITGVPIALYWMARRETGGKRWLWLLPLAVFFYTLILTSSRGSMLALMAGLGVLFLLRHGRRRSVMVGLAVFPVLLIVFAGRMTDFTSSEGTGSGRIQLWSEGLWMFREAPLWGVGMNEFRDAARLVAHNSFHPLLRRIGAARRTHAVPSAFVLAARHDSSVARPGAHRRPRACKLHPFLMAFFVAFLVGIPCSCRGPMSCRPTPCSA